MTWRDTSFGPSFEILKIGLNLSSITGTDDNIANLQRLLLLWILNNKPNILL